jgi:undecaprenyl diphosphate synthase
MKFPDMGTYVKPGSPEEALLRRVDFARLPRHVAVIMDGNGRWARERGKPRVFGHRHGVESVRVAVESAARLGIPILTLYAFSIENWKRPADEVRTLFGLLRRYLRKEMPVLMKNRIRMRPIGRLRDLDPRTREALRAAEEKTARNSGMLFQIALSYSGRAELADAFTALAREMSRNGGLGKPVTEEAIARHLYTAGQDDPDLLIRSSGERRVSNFLLWQIAYTELYVTGVAWPDFRTKHLLEAILDYQGRERRYGGVEGTGRPPAEKRPPAAR